MIPAAGGEEGIHSFFFPRLYAGSERFRVRKSRTLCHSVCCMNGRGGQDLTFRSCSREFEEEDCGVAYLWDVIHDCGPDIYPE